jgi:hypothetical protein
MGDIGEEVTPGQPPAPPTRELIYHQKTRGIDVLRDPKINKVRYPYNKWYSV